MTSGMKIEQVGAGPAPFFGRWRGDVVWRLCPRVMVQRDDAGRRLSPRVTSWRDYDGLRLTSPGDRVLRWWVGVERPAMQTLTPAFRRVRERDGSVFRVAEELKIVSEHDVVYVSTSKNLKADFCSEQQSNFETLGINCLSGANLSGVCRWHWNV